jgi:hypothetical protein
MAAFAVMLLLGGRCGARRTAARPDAVDGLWVTLHGLWVAAAAGRYPAVRCTAGPVTLTRRAADRPEEA